MSITLREAGEPDLAFLLAMNGAVHALHLAAAPAFFREPEPREVEAMFRARFEHPETQVWIAEAEGTPAGFAVSSLRERPENALCRAQRYCELEEVCVAPAARRKGVARALVERVIAEARARGIDDIQLVCWAFNAEAQAAFAALGFEPLSVRFQRGG